MANQKPLGPVWNAKNMEFLKDWLCSARRQDAIGAWAEDVSSYSLPSLIQLGEHDGQPSMPRLASFPTCSEIPPPVDWRKYHRVRTRSLASLAPHGNAHLHEKMADLDKLLELKLSFLIALEFEPKGGRQRDTTDHGYKDTLLRMLFEPVDPELNPQHDLVVSTRCMPKRNGSTDSSHRFDRRSLLDTRLNHSIRLDILTSPKFVEHYHMAHLCLIDALSRRLARLQGTRLTDMDILHIICKGWNFNLKTKKRAPVGSYQSPMATPDVSPDNSTLIQEVQNPDSEITTLDRISAVEDKLIQKIAEVEAENLAAAEGCYECIHHMYDE